MEISEEELRKLLNGTTHDVYNFDKDTTFIKEQNITVQSGANFYNGNQPHAKNNDENGSSNGKDIMEYTIDELRQIVNQVLPMIGTNSKSYYFPVVKVFMWKGRIPDHDFEAGIKFLNQLYPHLNFGKKEQYNLAEYDVNCFYKSFDRWKDEDAPVHKNTFMKYWNIADTLLKLLG